MQRCFSLEMLRPSSSGKFSGKGAPIRVREVKETTFCFAMKANNEVICFEVSPLHSSNVALRSEAIDSANNAGETLEKSRSVKSTD